MTTQVDDTGLAFIAGLLATRAVTISAHTADPGATGANSELPTSGSGVNYARHTEAAANWTATGVTADNDNAIDMFTPGSGDAGMIVTYLGIRFGAVWYGRIQLLAPVTLVQGRPFRIAAGTIDLMMARPT